VGSQDCPEASGLRTIEEVLAGHRAQGVFDPAMWWLVRDASKPVGVLLINAVRDESVWEVVYMGIVPEARGRGYGRQLLNFALREARSAGVGRVELSVDSRNIYACQIYRLLGFELVNIRLVYLAALGPQQLS
jgi:ribosomal protein S18 acetylase RimI-like enzyme